MLTLSQQIKAARRVKTPIIALVSADAWATIEMVTDTVNGAPKFLWDALRGVRPMNPEAEAALVKMGDPAKIAAGTMSPRNAIDFAQSIPQRSAMFMVNMHLFIEDPVVQTGLSVLRDQFKSGDGRTLFLLAPVLALPVSLQQDVVLLDEAFPDDEALEKILDGINVKGTAKAAGDVKAKAIRAARGLSAFMAEQTFAMSYTPSGLDVDECRGRKRAAINAVDGLTWLDPEVTFADVRGLAQITEFFDRLMKGEDRPECVVFIDELDKHLAGSTGGDLSGVSADALGALLRWMEDRKARCLMLLGPGGSGKSLVGKAVAATYDVPGIAFDLGASKGSLVGESERKIRTALKTIDGVAGGKRVLVIATCNRVATIPPEMRRRMTLGTWYFDLLDEKGRDDCWKLYAKKYGVDVAARPDDEGWTGAEIRNCCDLARSLKVTPKQAAAYIVPINVAAPEQVKELRELAHDRFLAAAYPGVYRKPESAALTGIKRSIE